ncbi:MAG: YqcC family protein [Succinivibrio sp.]
MSYESEFEVLKALEGIEKALRNLSLWSDGKNRPKSTAFVSTTPFFMDTMDFHQWLEFVLIPRFRQMLQNHDPLPSKVNIHPYAQEIYRGRWQEYKELIQKLIEFDKLFE